jgi:capsule polysaccharide export protein KpsE/RkpR
MDNNTQSTTTSQEIAEVIAELEEYRERLVNETMETAKKAKMMKATAMAQLEAELAKIDAALENLKEQQAILTANN